MPVERALTTSVSTASTLTVRSEYEDVAILKQSGEKDIRKSIAAVESWLYFSPSTFELAPTHAALDNLDSEAATFARKMARALEHMERIQAQTAKDQEEAWIMQATVNRSVLLANWKLREAWEVHRQVSEATERRNAEQGKHLQKIRSILSGPSCATERP